MSIAKFVHSYKYSPPLTTNPTIIHMIVLFLSYTMLKSYIRVCGSVMKYCYSSYYFETDRSQLSQFAIFSLQV